MAALAYRPVARVAVALLAAIVSAPSAMPQTDAAWPDGLPHVLLSTGAECDFGADFQPDNHGGLVVDADGDGDLDVLLRQTVHSELRRIVLLRNDGGGRFVEDVAAEFTGPDAFSTRWLSAGDLDRDGLTDVVALGNDGFAVLHAIGPGSYAVTLTPLAEIGLDPWLVDVDGDGLLDLVRLRPDAPEYDVALRPGLGDGSFGADEVLESGITVGPFAPFQTLGDLDGDGDTDLVVAAGQQILASLQGPDGFGPSQLVDAAPSGRFLLPRLVDLDGDANLDLVCAWTLAGIGAVSWWPGLGDGSFGLRIDRVIPDGVLGALPADLDEDGSPDLVVAGRSGAYVLRGLGNLGFLPTVSYSEGEPLAAVRVADLTGDGLDELIVETRLGTGLRVHVGIGDATFERLGVLATAVGADLGDVTGDGLADAALGFSDRIELRPALAGGGFGAPVSSVAHPAAAREITFEDLNGDAVPDLVGLGASSPELGTLTGFGGGSFGVPWSTPVSGLPSDLHLADLDGDGDPDIVLRAGATTLRVFLGGGDGSFTELAAAFDGIVSGETLAVGDLDGDEIPDVASTLGFSLHLRSGNGDGSFATPLESAPAVAVPITDVDLADVDDDGLADLLLVAGEVLVALGPAEGPGFTDLQPLPGTATATRARFADVDADGALDVLALLPSGGVRLLYGDRAGGFDDRGDTSAFGLLSGAVDVALGDVDADGDRDLLPVHAADVLGDWIGVGDVLGFDERRRFEQRGSSLGGAAGHATLAGIGTLAAGDPVRVLLQSALPGAPATLVLSPSFLDFPMLGGVLVPAPDILLGGLPIDADGRLDLGGPWPAGVPGGLEVFLQAWFPDGAAPHGWAASPGLVLITP